MKLLHALRNAAHRLSADFEDSKLFDHSGDKGEFREQIVGRFLRPFLPDCYGIGSGQVFAADDEASKQIDIVIYDAIFSNVLFRDAGNSLFPSESVYGTVEVKSRLSTEELEDSIANIESVKCLSRSSSDMCDILPFRRIRVGAGLTYGREMRNPYLGIIFAYGGLTAETVTKELNQHLRVQKQPPQYLPDFVFSHHNGYTVIRTLHGVAAKFGGAFDGYQFIESGDDTLPLFFLTLNTCLNQIILKAPDFNSYWIGIVNEIATKQIGNGR